MCAFIPYGSASCSESQIIGTYCLTYPCPQAGAACCAHASLSADFTFLWRRGIVLDTAWAACECELRSVLGPVSLVGERRPRYPFDMQDEQPLF